MTKKDQNCMNCGHKCHCGVKCEQEIINEFKEKYKITCCSNCRHVSTDSFDENEVKYDSIDYDSFNGE